MQTEEKVNNRRHALRCKWAKEFQVYEKVQFTGWVTQDFSYNRGPDFDVVLSEKGLETLCRVSKSRPIRRCFFADLKEESSIMKRVSSVKVLHYLAASIFVFAGSLFSLSAIGASGSKNFDGSYSIDYSNSKCGNLGYSFKILHQKDGYSSTSAMSKSNCKIISNGNYEGYIYPKKRPNMRIFWVQTTQGVTYKD